MTTDADGICQHEWLPIGGGNSMLYCKACGIQRTTSEPDAADTLNGDRTFAAVDATIAATPQSATPPAPVPAGECQICGAPIDPDCGHVGACLPAHPLPASAVDGREGEDAIADADILRGMYRNACRELGLANKELAALRTRTPGPVVDGDMIERAEAARVHSLNSLVAYGSAGVEERHQMAMREAITAALTPEQRPSEQEGGR